MPLALEGIRILDLTTWQQGPGCTVLLADMGADVVKIEDPVVGDPARAVSMHPNEAARRAFSFLEAMNHSKRAMTLNLRSDEGRAVFYRMAQRADVVATNFRLGVCEELGIDYATLKQHNPRIIAAVSTAMGQRGPDASQRFLDILGHARSGLMTLLADPEQPLRYVGAWGLADHAGAVMFCNAILAALVARSIHGVGQEVTVSQLSALLTWQSLPVHTFLFNRQQPRTLSRTQTRSPLLNIYKARDGKWLAVSCSPPDRFWKAFCRAMGLERLLEDPRFRTIDGTKHAAELVRVLDEAFLARDRDDWVRALTAADLMAVPVQDYADVERDPQVTANGYIVGMEHPEAGTLKLLASPIAFTATPTRAPFPAPQHGQHTEAVLLEHGYTWEQIAAFRGRGVI